MKLAILSDIHGNRHALEATAADIDAWKPDVVVVNGDVVNDGPSNPYCRDFVARRVKFDGWIALRGNHEEYVAEWRDPNTTREGPAYDLIRLSRWTYEQLGGRVDDLATLPERWDYVAPDGSRLVVMHGTLLGNRVGIYPFTSDDEVRRRVAPGARVFATAHTHVPHLRMLDDVQIVNTGSVGIPGDGDGRAAYGRLVWAPVEGWRAEVVRVAYDRAAAERDYFTSGFIDGAGPEAELSLVQFRLLRDVRTRWSAHYRERIARGELSLAEAVDAWLEQPEFRPFRVLRPTSIAGERGPISLIRHS